MLQGASFKLDSWNAWHIGFFRGRCANCVSIEYLILIVTCILFSLKLSAHTCWVLFIHFRYAAIAGHSLSKSVPLPVRLSEG